MGYISAREGVGGGASGGSVTSKGGGGDETKGGALEVGNLCVEGGGCKAYRGSEPAWQGGLVHGSEASCRERGWKGPIDGSS